MLAGLAWLGGLISMISESLGELLTTMRVGPIVVGPRIDEKLDDIPEGRKNLLPKWQSQALFSDVETLNSDYDDPPEEKIPTKKYKNSIYNTKTEWKESNAPDL